MVLAIVIFFVVLAITALALTRFPSAKNSDDDFWRENGDSWLGP